jgi:hypothetical protein
MTGTDDRLALDVQHLHHSMDANAAPRRLAVGSLAGLAIHGLTQEVGVAGMAGGLLDQMQQDPPKGEGLALTPARFHGQHLER